MKKTWNERMSEALKASGMSKAEFARRVGVSAPTVTDWMRGGIGSLKAGSAERASAVLGVTTQWLLYGKEPRHAGQIAVSGPPVGEYRSAPVVGTAQLGEDGFWLETGHPVGFGDGFVDAPTRDPNAYALRVRGDSMAPAIRNGWLVVIEPNQVAVTGELVLICTDDGMCMVKELLADRQDEVYLGSVNQDFKPVTVQKSRITRMHYVAFIAPPSKLRL